MRTDGHVHELYIKPKGQWVNNDLIIKSGNGITPSRTRPLCGYMAQDNGQHVNFTGTDGHVHELYNLHSAQWINNDLTQLAAFSGPSVPPAPDSRLFGFWAAEPDEKQHVNFIGTDGHVHDLSIAPKGHWIDNDLTIESGNGMLPEPTTALLSYALSNGDLHANYIGAFDGHLHELLLALGATQWVNNDLNNIPLVDFLRSPLPTDKIAPINAFELNLVGPWSGGNAVLSSGAGTIIYAAASPLTVTSEVPPCVSVNFFTQETSNSVYDTLDGDPSNIITQTFSIDPTKRVIRFKGPLSKGLTPRPIKPD